MTAVAVTYTDILQQVSEALARHLKVPVESIGATQSIYYLGLSSLESMQLLGGLEDALDLQLDFTVLYDHPTVEALARHLLDLKSGAAVPVAARACDESSPESPAGRRP